MNSAQEGNKVYQCLLGCLTPLKWPKHIKDINDDNNNIVQ